MNTKSGEFRFRALFSAFVILLSIPVLASEAPPTNSQQTSSATETGLVLPEGFSATVFADRLGVARHIAVRDNGDVYIALRRLSEGHGIVALRDSNGDGRADQMERFGEFAGSGIGIYQGYLYFATDSAVMRYRLREGELLPDETPEMIIEGFPEQSSHPVKPFTFDGQGHIYVDVGAPSNACQERSRTPGSPGQDPCPQLERQAGIWRFDADRPGQTQQADGYHYATGIRHAVALDWNFEVGDLYVVQHGRDQLHQLWPELFTEEQSAELPAEEFLLVAEGSNFGWPYCYWDQFQDKRILAPEYGGDGKETGRCSEFEEPILAFPGHWAPNDLIFYTGDQFPEKYRNGAFIAFHGSWNRAPLEQQGYMVAFVPFEGSKPSGEWERFADGFAGQEKISSPGDARYRPTGLAIAHDGSLYVSETVQGRVWKISYQDK